MTKHARFTIPIYGIDIYLWLTPDVKAERMQVGHLFGEIEVDEDVQWAGLVSCANQNFGLFLDSERLTMATFAHELLHLTHRILEYIGAPYDSEHQEVAALLQGYLAERCLQVLRLTPGDLHFTAHSYNHETLPGLYEMPGEPSEFTQPETAHLLIIDEPYCASFFGLDERFKALASKYGKGVTLPGRWHPPEST